MTLNSRGQYLSGLLSMIIGSSLVLSSIIIMNRYTSAQDKKKETASQAFAVVKQEKPKPKKKLKKPKPKRVTRRTNRAPTPLKGLNSALSGIDMGLPGIVSGDLDKIDSGILGNSQASIMTEDAVDVAPRATSRGRFIYPRSAKKQGIRGYVTLSLLISESGRIEQVSVIESSPQGVFDNAALKGIRSWRFDPAQYQGRSVKTWVKQKIRFDLG